MKNSPLYQWIVDTAREAAWAPLLVYGLHVMANRGFDAYTTYPALDIPMHFFGGVVIAFFVHRASINASRLGLLGPYHAVTHRLLVFAMVGTITIFWEFAEFLSDRFLGSHAQVDLEDTLFDMLLGMLGGLCFLLAVARRTNQTT